jgi:hypothetical protein
MPPGPSIYLALGLNPEVRNHPQVQLPSTDVGPLNAVSRSQLDNHRSDHGW